MSHQHLPTTVSAGHVIRITIGQCLVKFLIVQIKQIVKVKTNWKFDAWNNSALEKIVSKPRYFLTNDFGSNLD
jgi:hypothetical protein